MFCCCEVVKTLLSRTNTRKKVKKIRTLRSMLSGDINQLRPFILYWEKNSYKTTYRIQQISIADGSENQLKFVDDSTMGAYWIPQNIRYIWGWWLEAGLIWGWIPKLLQYFTSFKTFLWVNYAFMWLWAVHVLSWWNDSIRSWIQLAQHIILQPNQRNMFWQCCQNNRLLPATGTKQPNFK